MDVLWIKTKSSTKNVFYLIVKGTPKLFSVACLGKIYLYVQHVNQTDRDPNFSGAPGKMCQCSTVWQCTIIVMCNNVHVWCRACFWRVLAGTATKCCWLSLYQRSSTAVCQWSGFVLARQRSLNHVQSISALCTRRVLDEAYLVLLDTRPTLCWCWTFRRSIRRDTGSTEASHHCVSLMIDNAHQLSLLSQHLVILLSLSLSQTSNYASLFIDDWWGSPFISPCLNCQKLAEVLRRQGLKAEA